MRYSYVFTAFAIALPMALYLVLGPSRVVRAGSAEPVVRLDDLVSELLKANPEIRAARADWEAAMQRPLQEGTLPNPVVGGRWKNVGFDELSQGLDPRSDLQIYFSQEVPFPGKLGLKEKASTERARAAGWRYDATVRKAVADLKEAYYDWFYTVKSIEITERNKALLQQFVDVARKKYEVGEGIQQDVVKAQVELSRFIEMLEVLRRQKAVVEAKIKSLLQRPPGEPLGVPDEVRQSPFALDFEELKRMLDDNAPRLKERERLIRSREDELKLARKQYLPDFILQGTYFNRNGGRDEFKDIWQLGVGLRVPLYFWRKERLGVSEASSRLTESMELYRAQREDLYYLLGKWYESLVTARRLVRLYGRGIIPQSKLSLDSAISGYEVGKVDFLTLIDNVITLFEFEREYWRQLTLYETSIARIEEIVGVELTETKEDKQ